MATDLGSFEKFLRVGEGRRLKRLGKQAAYIGTLEEEFESADLPAKTAEFRQRIENGETTEDILFEAYAAVREAFKRTMDVRLFDVQMMGGIALHEGDIAEMKTGAGKTFVAPMPLYPFLIWATQVPDAVQSVEETLARALADDAGDETRRQLTGRLVVPRAVVDDVAMRR